MKNAFFTDILRELRESAGRYVGMFAIVALGVCVFAGLGSTGSTMKSLSDQYYRDLDFMDIRVISTYGINQNDVTAIAAVEGVALVQPSYTMDVFASDGDTDLILKLHSVEIGDKADNQLNKPHMVSGRMPERSGEALVEPALMNRLGIALGDTVELHGSSSSDIRAGLRTVTYRVVGVARSPLYYSNLRGSSSIGNGSVDYYMLVPSQDFRRDVYSEALIRVEGAEGLYTYARERETLVDEVIDRLEALAEIRETERKAELTRSAFSALNTAEQELASRRRSAYAQFDEAARRIEETRRTLASGRLDLAQGELQLLESRLSLEESRFALWSGMRRLDEGAEAVTVEWTLRRGMLELGGGEETLLEQEEVLLEQFHELRTVIDRLDKGAALLKEQLAQADLDRQAVEQALMLSPGDPVLTAQLAQIDAAIVYMQTQLDALPAAYAEANAGLSQLRGGLQEITTARETLNNNRAALLAGISAIGDSRAELELQRQSLLEGAQALEEGRSQLLDARIELDTNRVQISAGERALRLAQIELDQSRADTLTQLAEAEAALLAQRAALYAIGDPVWHVLGRDANESYVVYDEDSDKIHTIGRVIPLLFFLVAALVSLTTMSRLVEEQRIGMGTLKSLGYGTGKILSKYIFYAFAPTFLGSLLGGWAGQIMFPSVIITAYSSLYPISPYGTYSFNAFYWLLGLLLAVCSTVFTTIYACMSELGSVPAVLMRGRAPRVGKKIPLEHLTFFWRRLSFLYKIAFRNLFRYKKRFFMTIVGVGLCTALLVVGFGLNESVSGLVGLQFSELRHMDLTVTYPEDAQGEASAVQKLLAESGVIRESTRVREKQMDLIFGDRTENVTMTVPQTMEEFTNHVTLRERAGKAPLELGNHGAVISEKLSILLGIGVGDEVVLKDSDDEEFAAAVSGICETYFGHYVFLSPEYYRAVFGEAHKCNTLYATAAPNAAEDALSALANTLLERDKVSSVFLVGNMVNNFSDSMGSLGMVTWVIIFSSAVLAFVVLLNLTNINITERIREIATIQVLGFHDNEVGAYVYRENRMVAVIGTAMGLVGGKYLHSYIMASVAPSSIMFSPDLGIVNYCYAALLTMFFVVCVDLMTSGKLRKIDMVGALKSTE